jgi:hypothetical protein
MNNDPSMLRDRLAYSLFREMGIAAPRAMHARVNINGKLEGLFVAVEQVDGRFTRSRFGEGGKGNLYKEIWPMHDSADSYRAALETNEDSNPRLDPIVAFAAATKQGSAAVENYIDRAYVARYLAADRVMANDDGSALVVRNSGPGQQPGRHRQPQLLLVRSGVGAPLLAHSLGYGQFSRCNELRPYCARMADQCGLRVYRKPSPAAHLL